MKQRYAKSKLTLIAVICALVACFALGGRAWAQVSGLSPQEKRGKQIYLKGEGGDGGEIKAILGSSDLELPASAFSCANCHGLRGEGTKEGGLQPPPLDWASLTSPRTSALTRRERGPYDEATLARAISSGVDPAGARLHPGMPMYKMTAGQMADLIAYLKKLGKEADADPGLTPESIKVGAALPMTGPIARVGEDVKAALGAYFAEVNSQGGVYGRKFEMVIEDSRGEPAGTSDATRRLVEKDGVFALVGSFEPGDSAAANDYLRQSEVPLVGPVTLSPRLTSVPNQYIFYLLPSFSDQARALVDFIALKLSRPEGKGTARLAAVYADGDFDRDALSGLRSQAQLRSMQIVAEQVYKPGGLAAASVIASLSAKKPDYVFFFGNSDDFTAFAKEMDRAKLESGLLSSAVMVGHGAFSLSPAMAARTYMSYPASLPNRDDFSEFLAVMQKAGVSLRSPAFQAVAYAAAKIFVEATKSGGKQLSRAALVKELEQLRNFKTGVIPPVSFGPNRRVGAAGSYIVGIDANNKQYMPLSEWIEPQAGSR